MSTVTALSLRVDPVGRARALGPAIEAAADTSTAFRTFIANAKISGVFQGTPARVMFNGRLARAGDTVEPTLGITFDGLDPDRKLILFKDKSGAVVTRRY